MKDNNENNNNKKSFKRKFLAATLGALIVVNIISVCDFSVVKFGDFSANLSNPDFVTMSVDEVDEETKNTFEQLVTDGIANFENIIPISELTLSSNAAVDLISDFLQKHPEYYYVKYTISGSYFRGDQSIIYATKVKLFYTEEPSVIQEQFNVIDGYVNEIISATDGMTDLEKALYVHDRLALDFSYDTRVHSSDESVSCQTNFNIYGFFRDNTGVCQAYSGAYKYILSKLGIQSRIVTSYEMGHAWNVVQIDGNWYHVDATWDDPEPDRQGNVHHEYFLLSDQQMSQTHRNWGFIRGENVECTDTTYDTYWWTDVCAEIFRIDGKWFSVNDNGEFLERDVQSGQVVQNSESSFTIERDKWWAWNSDTSYWMGNYTTLVNKGDEFFYNTTENVYVINIDGSNKRLVASFPKAEHNGFQIYGLAVDEDNMLYVNLQNNPQDVTDDNGNVVQPMQVEKVIISDINTASSSAVPIDNTSLPSGDSNVVSFINWQEITDTLKNNNSVEVSIKSKDAELPSDVVENVKGKDLDIIIDMDTYKWTINGNDVSDGTIADVKLGVEENLGVVPDEVNDMYIDDQKTVEVNLDHEGQFGYNATLSIYVGKEYAGMVASILHYQPENNRLDYQESVIIDEQGYANLPICHASSYMVVIDDKIVGLPGDIDDNGISNLKDYVLMKQFLVGKCSDDSSIKIANTDMNADGRISISDAVLLARQIVE